MALRVALVTPFAWSQPHDVNEHVAGLARELRARGHSVTVLAPSNRAARPRRRPPRARDRRSTPSSIALGPAVPISRRSRMGVPVGVRANLAVALARRRLRHRARLRARPAEPLLPRAPRRRRADGRDVLLAPSGWRIRRPRRRRERLLGRLDALLATSAETAEAAAERFPGRYELVPLGVDLELAPARRSESSSCSSGGQTERPLLRALARELAAQPDWELAILCARAARRRGRRCRARSAAGRGSAPPSTPRPATSLLRDAAVFVPAFEGIPRVELEARAAGAAVASPPGARGQPELAAAEAARLMEDDAFRARRAAEGLAAAQRRRASRPLRTR